MTVVIKYDAFSNISYRHRYDTGLTREEWESLSDRQRCDIAEEGIWDDIDWLDVDGDEDDCE